MSMGDASVASFPESAIPENIALFNTDHILINTTVSNRYLIKELSPVFIYSTIPLKKQSVFTAGIGRVGGQQFSEQFGELGFAKLLGKKITAGIKIQYHQWHVNDTYYYNSNAIIPEICIYANPLRNISFGALIRNPVRFRMNAIDKPLPVTIHSGLAIRVSEKISLACSVIQQSDLPLSFQTGLEYALFTKIFIRFGCRSLPLSQSFGFGVKLTNWKLDVAYRTEPILGNSSSITLTYLL